MITIPTASPELLKQLEVDFGSTVAAAIWKKIVAQQNYMNSSIPIGSIFMFLSNQTITSGTTPLTPPGSSNWQFCDGSVISNANSPMNGQNTPDLRNCFLRSGSTIGTLGGSNTASLTHRHGGPTSTESDRVPSGPLIVDNNTQTWAGVSHHHLINNDLGTIDIKPQHFELQPFMRIV